jgi:hypothetical protein
VDWVVDCWVIAPRRCGAAGRDSCCRDWSCELAIHEHAVCLNAGSVRRYYKCPSSAEFVTVCRPLLQRNGSVAMFRRPCSERRCT